MHVNKSFSPWFHGCFLWLIFRQPLLLYIRMHATNFNFFTLFGDKCFRRKWPKGGRGPGGSSGEAEIECVIGVSRQVIINFILLNWWAILKKKEIIKNMKVNTVLKKKKKKTHRKQIINISIKKKKKQRRRRACPI